MEIVDANVPIGLNQLIGLVRNVSDRDIYNLSLTFHFHDASGAIVESKFGTTLLYTTPASSLNAFEVFFPADVPASAEALSIEVEWIEGAPSVAYSREGIRVVRANGQTDAYTYTVTGEIQNTTSKMAGFITLVGIAYSGTGRFVGQTLTTMEDLPAGESVPFALAFQLDRLPEEISRFEVLTEARLED